MVFVLSLGGSLINPGGIDVEFLARFRDFVLGMKHKFIIVCGGGTHARDYISAVSSLSDTNPDFVGIEATRLNASLVSSLFHKRPKVFSRPERVSFGKVLCCYGWKPGCSTDYEAVLWSEVFRVSSVFNLTDVDYVYDRPPGPDAVPLSSVSWRDFLSMFGDWSSGMHAPFDPVAAKRAMRMNISVYVLNGNNLYNLKRALEGRTFVGSVLS